MVHGSTEFIHLVWLNTITEDTSSILRRMQLQVLTMTSQVLFRSNYLYARLQRHGDGPPPYNDVDIPSAFIET
jgi:hypothetical protein